MIARSVDVGKNCISCKERYVGCHSKCEKYKEAHEEWELERERTRKQRLSDSVYMSTHCRNINNTRKGKK